VRVAADLEVKGAARLGSLWVEPEARGTRVGGALVDAAVGWAREHGYSRILLDVANGNHAAIGLYENAGFLPTGRIMHFPAPREDLGKHERSKTL
jgi:ribosomal protein S18 acetylase RimI-like enzyme